MYVYGLKDPRYFQPRYVGITNKPLLRRLNNHLADNEINHRTNWIKSLTKEGLRPEIFVIEELNNSEDLKQREIYWIAYLKSKGYKLVNGTLGGDGGFGRVVTQKQKDHQSYVMKGKKFPNRKPMPQWAKDHLSQISSGHIMTDDNKIKLIESNKKDSGNWTQERKNKIGDALRGKPKSKEHTEKMRQNAIGKLIGSKNGNSKLTDDEVRVIIDMADRGISLKDVHAKYSHIMSKSGILYVMRKSKMRSK